MPISYLSSTYSSSSAMRVLRQSARSGRAKVIADEANGTSGLLGPAQQRAYFIF